MLARVLVGHRASLVDVVHLRSGQRFTIGDHPHAGWLISHPSLPPLEHVELVRVTSYGVALALPNGGSRLLAPAEAVRLEYGEVWLHISATPTERLKLGRRAPDWGLLASTTLIGVLAATFAALVHATPDIAPLEELPAEPAYVRLSLPPTLDAKPEQPPIVRPKPPPPMIPECDEQEAGRGAPKAAARKPRGAAKPAASQARAQPQQRMNGASREPSEPNWASRDYDAGILAVMSQDAHFLASPYGSAFAVNGGDVWGGGHESATSWEGLGGGYGTGGMGLVGTGRGGGGSGEGTIGLGNAGLIGHGGWGVGGGCPVCRPKHKPKPKVQIGRLQIEGEHDQALIRRVTKAKLRQLQACYDTALQRDAKLRGKVELKYVLGRDGSVSTVLVEHTPDRSLGECMAKVLKISRFPAGRSAGSIVRQTITLGAKQP